MSFEETSPNTPPESTSAPWAGPQSAAPPQPPLDAPFQDFPGYQVPPPAPAPKKRTGLIVGISVGAVVAIGVVAAIAIGSGSSGTDTSAAAGQQPATTFTGAAASEVASLIGAAVDTPTPSAPMVLQVTVPASAGGLTKMTGTVGDRVTAAMKKADAGVADLANADFAAYSKTGSSGYFANLTLLPLSNASDVEQEYQTDGAASTLAAASSGDSISDSENVDTPIAGGAMTCGLVTVSGTTLRDCLWIDASEFAVLTAPSSASNAQASAYAVAIWCASESS